jgi:hypothetical protein
MKNAVITRTDADPATARDGFLDDPLAPLANTSWTTSHPAIFSESSF